MTWYRRLGRLLAEYLYRAGKAGTFSSLFFILVAMVLVYLSFFVLYEHGAMTDAEAVELVREVNRLVGLFAGMVLLLPALEMGLRRIEAVRERVDQVNDRWESFGEGLP